MEKDSTNGNNAGVQADDVTSDEASTQNDVVVETPSLKVSVPAEVATAAVATAPSDKSSNVLIAVVGLLVLMAGVQVFQTQQLYAAVSSGAVMGGAQPAQQQSGGSALPSQVGGCG